MPAVERAVVPPKSVLQQRLDQADLFEADGFNPSRSTSISPKGVRNISALLILIPRNLRLLIARMHIRRWVLNRHNPHGGR